ncbi:winged helix DNA-binding domain-containing protein, partial [Cylindrobasidium torrendii FP15055 ss-10]
RPPYSMYQLIAVAIYSHPLKRARASEIRKLLGERFPYFVENKKELGETLKHALSSYELFHRVERASGDKERGCQWELDVRTNPCGRRTRTR